LHPDGTLDAVYAARNGETLAAVYITAAHGPDVTLAFDDSVLTPPGGADTITVLVDLDDSAPLGYFQMQVNAQDLEVEDATDGKEIVDLAGEFPLSSGIARIIQPAESISFAADGMFPSNITANEDVCAFKVHYERDGASSGSLIRLEELIIDVLDVRSALADPDNVIASVSLADESGVVNTNWSIQGGRIHVEYLDELFLGDGERIEMFLNIRTVEEPALEVFSMQIAGQDDISCSDETTGGAVTVSASQGYSFPFGSGRAALLLQDVERAFSNYPNPFVAGLERTRITFYMPYDGTVALKVYTITGRPVTSLLDGEYRVSGLHQDVFWDGDNGRGDTVLNGVYYLLLQIGGGGREYELKRKVAVLR
jgi:hypothetical protein